MSKEQAEQVIALLRAAPSDPNATTAQARARMEEATSMLPVGDGVTVTEGISANGVTCDWIVPDGANEDRAILYLHGGAYCVGSRKTHRALAAELARVSDAPVLVADYGLAPENPYPEGIEDAVNAYQWLETEKNIPANMIGIAGDSAGGGLTMATLLMLRDREMGEPACGMVISPWVDMTCSAKSYETRRDRDPMIVPDNIQGSADLYLNGKDAESHLASPVFARLNGLPPLLIQVGTEEVLYDDAVRLAGRAVEAHIDVTLECWDGMFHVWHAFYSMLDEGQEAIAAMGQFYKDKIGR
ncbi:MAG: alpha/beta hydrolase [Alphaproteobacteria bacterium]